MSFTALDLSFSLSPVSHVLLDLLDLLAVLPARRVQRLDQVRRVPQEHGVARRAAAGEVPFNQVQVGPCSRYCTPKLIG